MNPILAYWVHDLSPFAIRFSENFGIRWYGLAYIAGFLVGNWYLGRYATKGYLPLNGEDRSNLLFYLIVGILAGGRLGYFIFYTPSAILEDPLSIFKVWEGGMASHGGMLGVLVALLLYARKQKIPFLKLSDLVITAVPPGLFFGRLANFINGELWGKASDVPWAVVFPESAPPNTPVDLIAPRHPSQLYEAMTEGLFLWVYLQIRLKILVKKETPPWGTLSAEFLIGYAGWRIFCEFFREPDEGVALLLGMSRGTFYSVFMIVAGIAIWFWTRRAARKTIR